MSGRIMQAKKDFKVRVRVWVYPGKGGWYFVSLPVRESREIKNTFGTPHRAWGAIPVQVTLGVLVWKTSIFPDSKSGQYILPLKADIRRRASVRESDTLTLSLLVL